MTKELKERYGILVNDSEWDLLHRSVEFRRDSIKGLTGDTPEDLDSLLADLVSIKEKGYIVSSSNEVTQDDIEARICETCE
tara:strand:+ start:8681 stop:8923 length:243 start_codon:yes stop_codon:yes gene_type:complete